jgi:hypothetical protein
MNDGITVTAIVEGKTEQVFIQKILAPYLAIKNIGISATQISKPGQKGGDVRFSRIQKDLSIHLKQRSNTYITTFVDYYGIKEWPGVDSIPVQASPKEIAKTINEATKLKVDSLFPEQQPNRRFIPFVAVHEFEALLFSNSEILAANLGIEESKISEIILECGSPEAINNNRLTASSKRLEKLFENGKFRKITIGIPIAEKIGIDKMREKCPLFNSWILTFEEILKGQRLI